MKSLGEPAKRLDLREEDKKRNRAAPAQLLLSTDADVSWFASTLSHIGEFDMISTVEDLTAEALFVSDLQASECPNCGAVEEAVTAMILRYGSDGCAAGVAAEFGDHPEAAVSRIRWVRQALRDTVAPPRHAQMAT
jgi:hypothetical protein